MRTDSPTVTNEATAAVAQLAASKGRRLHQSDVDSAFLHGQRETCNDGPIPAETAFNARKAVYGLNDAPLSGTPKGFKRRWIRTVSSSSMVFLCQRNDLLEGMLGVHDDDDLMTDGTNKVPGKRDFSAQEAFCLRQMDHRQFSALWPGVHSW